MGYSIVAYGVDSKKLEKFFGSKNEKVAKEIKQKFKEHFKNLNQDFEEELEDVSAELKSEHLLDNIINGVIQYEELNFLYGYVYEILCSYFGQIIQVPYQLFGLQYLEVAIREYSFFMNIPAADDFPHVISILQRDFEITKNCLLSVEPKYLIWGGESQKIEWKEDIEYLFNYLSKNKLDLVLFNY